MLGITWHDGAPITAEEIQWNIEYALKTTVLNSVFRSAFEAIEGSGAYLDGSAEHISGIVVDGNTITLNFDRVAPDALLVFTQFAPLPKKYLTDVDPVSLQQAEYLQRSSGYSNYGAKISCYAGAGSGGLIDFHRSWKYSGSVRCYL
ncbi:ABC transporter substrate-binding protein [Enterocloster clostridioformis]|uniref:ABC transporter substrate-binding protein n=1 Tax=Enterocloster clostridioformis TaxID=1531 RepID=UPI0026754A44|nr:ABC transporter substrate-binding protein [Enterocloster clostridioformis]